MTDTAWRDRMEIALNEAARVLADVARIADMRTGDDEPSVANQDDPFGEYSARDIDNFVDAARDNLDRASHVITYAKSLGN